MTNNYGDSIVYERKCELLCRCSVEVFEGIGSKEDVPSHKIKSLNKISCASVLYELDESIANCSCTNVNDLEEHNELKKQKSPNSSSESISYNLSSENMNVKNETSEPNYSTDECVKSNEEDIPSEETVETHPSTLVTSTSDILDKTNAENDITNADECINDEFIQMLIYEYIEIGINADTNTSSLDECMEQEATDADGVSKTVGEEHEGDTGENNSANLRHKINSVDKIIPDNIIGNPDDSPKLSKTMFGNGVEVIRNSSLPSLVGVSAGMLMAAVGVIYFWHSASGIMQ